MAHRTRMENTKVNLENDHIAYRLHLVSKSLATIASNRVRGLEDFHPESAPQYMMYRQRPEELETIRGSFFEASYWYNAFFTDAENNKIVVTSFTGWACYGGVHAIQYLSVKVENPDGETIKEFTFSEEEVNKVKEEYGYGWGFGKEKCSFAWELDPHYSGDM